MRFPLTQLSLIVLSFLVCWASAQCNTDQNPYCAGNLRFEQLCCQYPAICYWSNRNGDPACCGAGQDCRADGGPGTTVVLPVTYVQATTAFATSTVTQPQQTVTYTPPTATQQFTSINSIATAAVVVATTAANTEPPAGAGGAFVMVNQPPSMAVSLVHDYGLLMSRIIVISIVTLALSNI